MIGTEFSDAKHHDRAQVMHANWYKRRLKVRLKRIENAIKAYIHRKIWGDLTKDEVQTLWRELRSTSARPLSSDANPSHAADAALKTKTQKSG